MIKLQKFCSIHREEILAASKAMVVVAGLYLFALFVFSTVF